MAHYPGNYNQSGYGSQPVYNYQQQQQYPQAQAPPPNPAGGYPPQQYPPQPYPPAGGGYGQPYGGGGYGQPYGQAPYPPQPYPPAGAYSSPPAPYPVAVPSPYPVATPYPVGVPVATPYPVAVPSPYPVVPAMPVMPAMNYVIQIKGSRLDRKDILSRSDPFLVLMASKHPGGYLSRQQIRQERKSTKHQKKFGAHSGNWVPVHRTETIHNNQNPVWAPFVVNLYTLCGGNLDSAFKIECWDSDTHTDHDFIGSCVVTIRDLQVTREIRIINKRRIGIFDSSGLLQVMKCAPA